MIKLEKLKQSTADVITIASHPTSDGMLSLRLPLDYIFDFKTPPGFIDIAVDEGRKDSSVDFDIAKEGVTGNLIFGSDIGILDWDDFSEKIYKSFIIAYSKLGTYSLDLLDESTVIGKSENLDWYTKRLKSFFNSYNVGVAKVVPINVGPRIIRFELYVEQGRYISGPMSVDKELALKLGVDSVLITLTGGRLFLDIPRKEFDTVRLVDIITNDVYRNSKYALPIPIGIQPTGKLLVQDLVSLPHMLIGGASGSGKSIYLHTVICSLMYKFTPEEIQLVLVDTKRIEFSFYRGIPYGKVYTDTEDIVTAMEELVVEMNHRYDIFEEEKVRSISDSSLPYKIVIIDEIGDLITQASDNKRLEKALLTLLRKARAVGIHFICATQRPSAEVVPGDVKANMPARLAFRVASNQDSQVIIDSSGAEKLLGAGDGLFKFKESALRIQGSMITVREIKSIVDAVSS